MTKSKIFSCAARSNSVNKHFIVQSNFYRNKGDPLEFWGGLEDLVGARIFLWLPKNTEFFFRLKEFDENFLWLAQYFYFYSQSMQDFFPLGFILQEFFSCIWGYRKFQNLPPPPPLKILLDRAISLSYTSNQLLWVHYLYGHEWQPIWRVNGSLEQTCWSRAISSGFLSSPIFCSFYWCLSPLLLTLVLKVSLYMIGHENFR